MRALLLVFSIALFSFSTAQPINETGQLIAENASFSFTFGNSTYEVSASRLNWYQANYACKIKGMTLVSIESNAENEAIRTAVRDFLGVDGFWTSGNDLYLEGQYYWDSTGHALGPFLGWTSGQPAASSASYENCICLGMLINHMWNDLKCEDPYRFICEKSACVN
ncbi:C-type lectin 37Db-like [Neocloeon triangulifer]|uniref:C-type lectin 37Db-like n=1 Tax=Neocloeon triangulifer TaxID=2078957 RepID=UPI00286F9D7E|nr:C-type lectin 37Db-like [Neocloeon triangulifer]